MNTRPSLKTAIAIWISLLITMDSLHAQPIDGLESLCCFVFNAYHSDGHEEEARKISTLTEEAYRYLQPKMGYSPQVTLMILSQNDWQKHASNVVYGMPHFTSNSTLVVAAEDNAFWQANMPPPELIDTEFTTAYTTPNGLSGKAFFELLAIHELGHAFFNQGGLKSQRIWLTELYMNIMLHSFIAEERPELLPALEQLPKKMASIPASMFTYTTLAQFEEHAYGAIAREKPANYGWYQFRFHDAARQIYDAAGEDVIVDLWDFHTRQTRKLSDEELLIELKKAHPSIADVMLNWDK